MIHAQLTVRYGVREHLAAGDNNPFVPIGNYTFRAMTRLPDVKTEALYGGSCPAIYQTRKCSMKEIWTEAMKDPALTDKYVTSSNGEVILSTEETPSKINFHFANGAVTAKSDTDRFGNITQYVGDKMTFTGDLCGSTGSNKKKLEVTVKCAEDGWKFDPTATRDGISCTWKMNMSLPGPCS